jgi:predicted metal-binding protein
LTIEDQAHSNDAPATDAQVHHARASDPLARDVTIVVCRSCRGPDGGDDYPRPGSRLVEDTQRAAQTRGIAVREVGCLGNCKRGLSAAMLCEGAWSYVFGGLAEDSGADLVAGAELFSSSTDGFMPFSRRPESLKRGLIARIPTLLHLKDTP